MEKVAYEIAGPFGGRGGDSWNDGIYTTVRQLVIYSGPVIDSIQIEYDENGQSKWSEKHGENDGGVRNMVKLEYPDEFLISISGYSTTESSNAVVQSLTIQSNRQQYGPFGKEEGKYFSTSPTSGMIIGFHGRSGLYLDSIGAYFKPISVGPFGGLRGQEWDDGIYTTIRQLTINYGSVVDSIQIEYDKNGSSKWSERHGESEGGTKSVVKLEYPNEFLISFTGYCNKESNEAVVLSLTFQSNKQLYGAYGKEEGTRFSSSSTNGKIIGFHGRCGLYLDSIGAYFEMLPISIGPFGGLGGGQWDDGIYTTIRQLIIFSGSVIDSIQIEYDENGQSKWSEKHGESQVDYPGEFLVSISSHYGKVFELLVIRSLKIESNKRTYGLFGVEEGEYFKFPSTSSKIRGFYGRSGVYLDSIGAYVE
ncbi:hypothetical protein F0562_019589 [Nyssa sinensis]|uniref:Jacalin-type lectin domain-containing protein n=1 Tax=Nyssa sinensis TaxID=561372 RepID=A0A5J5BRX4_9ASTE|nr:hypothetical protein F0562_019589 [Nyssa sinensis]